MCIQAFQKLKTTNGFGILSSVKAKVDHESSMFSPQNCQISISPGYDTRYNRKVIKYDSEFNLVKEARSFKENNDENNKISEDIKKPEIFISIYGKTRVQNLPNNRFITNVNDLIVNEMQRSQNKKEYDSKHSENENIAYNNSSLGYCGLLQKKMNELKPIIKSCFSTKDFNLKI